MLMKVLMTSTSYPRDSADWRGVFVFHMAAALARRHDLHLQLWAPPGVLPPGVDTVSSEEESKWLHQLMEDGGVSHLLRKRPGSGLYAAIRLLRSLRMVFLRTKDAELYHINWLQCALPLPADGKPALITVLGNDLKLLRLPYMRSLLARVMRNRTVVLCPNADWMDAPLRHEFGHLAKVVPVPFGIDSRWYAIERVLEAIAPLRWLVVTRLTLAKLGPLFEWSQPLFADGQRELHLFGPMQETVRVPDWVHYHGPIGADALAQEWFPRAAGLVTLSRHAEGRPQVMLEGMAASLPIIATRMPAHEDIVQDGVTGILCSTREDYARALTQAERPERNRAMGDAARSWVLSRLGTWDDCAQRYVKLYDDLRKEQSCE